MKTKIIQLRSCLLTSLVEKTKLVYIRLFNKKRKNWQISINELEKYPPQTLGKDLAIFLIKENFDLMPGLESHDVYHLILNYSTKVEDEAKMQFFLIGNGKKSLYAFGTSFLAFLTMPDQWLAFWKAYQQGQKAFKVHLWDFRFLLKEKTEDLRALVKGRKRNENILLTY